MAGQPHKERWSGNGFYSSPWPRFTCLWATEGRVHKKFKRFPAVAGPCHPCLQRFSLLLERHLEDVEAGIAVEQINQPIIADVDVIGLWARLAIDRLENVVSDLHQRLFTKYFLTGMSGEGDRNPYGNCDGKVSLKELKKYLDDTMTYYARRYYGRTQKAQMIVNGKELSVSN